MNTNPRNSNAERLTVSVPEAAALLGISVPTAYRLTKTAGFPVVHIGGRMDALKSQRRTQLGWKRASCGLWKEQGFVFSNEIGDYLSPHTLYHNFKRVAAAIGVPNARFHDLRHTFATLSIQAGDDLKTVQNNLGHSTITTTMNTYAHVTDEMKRASANRMQSFIDGVRNPG